MTSKSKGKFILFSVLTLAFAAFSPIMPLFALVAGVTGAINWFNSEKKAFPLLIILISFSLFVTSSFLLGLDIYYIALVAILFLVPMVLIAVCYSKGLTFQATVLLTATVLGGFIIGIIILYVYLKGGEISLKGAETAFGWLINEFNTVADAVVKMYTDAGSQNLADMYKQFFEEFRVSVTEYYVPMFLGIILNATLLFSAVAALTVKILADIPNKKKIGIFSSFRTERIVAILMIAAYIAVMFLDNSALSLTVKNLVLIGNAYFAVSGAAYISFILNMRKASTGKKCLVYGIILTVCVMLTGLDLLSVFGIMEGVIQTRGKFEKLVSNYGFDSAKENASDLLEKIKKKVEKEQSEKSKNDVPWYERDEYKNNGENEQNDNDNGDKGE